jgi:hypothetical protein
VETVEVGWKSAGALAACWQVVIELRASNGRRDEFEWCHISKPWHTCTSRTSN